MYALSKYITDSIEIVAETVDYKCKRIEDTRYAHSSNIMRGLLWMQAIYPTNSIKMKKDEDGFDYKLIDSDTCVKCYQCLKVCSIKMN